MSKRRPAAIVRLDRGRLTPVTAWDAELLAEERNGQEYDLVRRTKRSTPHNSKYWVQLSAIVKATEAFATPDHMHTWIKCKLGYTAPIFGPQGQVIGMTVDSVAFDKMDQAAFNVFYEKAVQLVSQEMGINMDQVRA
jgi:hypothetical protein